LSLSFPEGVTNNLFDRVKTASDNCASVIFQILSLDFGEV